MRLGSGLAQAKRARLCLHDALLGIAVPERVGTELLLPKVAKGPCGYSVPCSSRAQYRAQQGPSPAPKVFLCLQIQGLPCRVGDN